MVQSRDRRLHVDCPDPSYGEHLSFVNSAEVPEHDSLTSTAEPVGKLIGQLGKRCFDELPGVSRHQSSLRSGPGNRGGLVWQGLYEAM